MGQLFEYLKIAIYNIKSNKMRSILTMLGIIIGISSVVMIVSAGNGIKNSIYSELNQMLGGVIDVSTNNSADADDVVTFDESDIRYLQKNLEHIKGVSPSTGLGNAWIETRKENYSSVLIMKSESGVYDDGNGMLAGRYFTEEECEMAAEVCVLGEDDTLKIFGTTDVIGSTLEVNLYGRYVNLKIVGIRKSSKSAISKLIFGTSRVKIEAPYTLREAWFGSQLSDFSGITVYSEDTKYTIDTVKEVVRLLEAKHDVREKNIIYAEEYESTLDQFNMILNSITAFIVLVAMISLAVGGIGIMNIMLVSVTERTKEIGIRKALGAKTGSILFQFLMEGGMISLLGGLIGITVGLLGATTICSVASTVGKMSLTADFNFVVIIGAALFSAAIGIFFTIYPAKRAARLNPIDALHHE